MVLLMKVNATVSVEDFFAELGWDCVKYEYSSSLYEGKSLLSIKRRTPLQPRWTLVLDGFDGSFRSLKRAVQAEWDDYDAMEDVSILFSLNKEKGGSVSLIDLVENAEWKEKHLEGLLDIIKVFALIERFGNGFDE